MVVFRGPAFQLIAESQFQMPKPQEVGTIENAASTKLPWQWIAATIALRCMLFLGLNNIGAGAPPLMMAASY